MLYEKRLEERKKQGNLRCLPQNAARIDFSSNDYLGLARSKFTGILKGFGSTGSRLLTGNSSFAEDLEKQIAHFHGFKTGTLFNCGYMANVGILSAIGGKEVTLFFDAHIHASMHEGMRLSRARAFPFRHNDLEHLENRLRKQALQGDRFICVESIYSMDGSCAPLKELCELAKKYDAHLIVDEAHAVGIYGPEGKGLVAEHQLTEDVFAQISTFGKALGTFGAIVLGSNSLKEALINFAPSFIYTTALPLQNLAAIKSSYDLFPKKEKERQKVQELIALFREAFPNSSTTHIQSVPIPGNEAVKHRAQKLADKGYDVRALLSPTVQKGKELLRICLHSFNTPTELKGLIQCLEF